MSPRDHVTDLRPLRSSRHFREIWAASALTGTAGQVAAVAALAQIWELTRSPIWTGAIGLAQGVPLLLLGPIGGSLADRYDRRLVVIASTLMQAAAAIALTIQATLGHASPGVLLTLLSLQAAAGALGSPARRTLPARLLPREEVGAGLALQNLAFQTSMLIGPAVGGLLVAASLPAAYATQALMASVGLVAALRLPALRPDRVDGAPIEVGAWTFASRSPIVRGALLTGLAGERATQMIPQAAPQFV